MLCLQAMLSLAQAPRSEFRPPGEIAHLSEKSQRGTFFLSLGASEDHALIFRHASSGA